MEFEEILIQPGVTVLSPLFAPTVTDENSGFSSVLPEAHTKYSMETPNWPFGSDDPRLFR